VRSDRTRSNRHKLKHRRFPLNVRKLLFYCEGNQALAQVAQGGCGLSTLGDTEKLPGHCLGGPA